MLLSTNAFKAVGALIDDGDNDWHPDRCKGFSTGLVRRDYTASPRFANANEFPDELLIAESDIKDALEQQIANHASLYELRCRVGGKLDSLNQDGLGLCWNFSTTKARMYSEAIDGEPIVPLSPWYGAGVMNNWKDQGGYCEKSMEFAIKHGGPKLALCPSYHKPSPDQLKLCEEDGMKRRVVKWWEGSGDKEKRTHQMISAALRGFVWVMDLNWMSHSMCGCRIVSFTSFSRLEVDTDNSWGMKSGKDGLYRLKDSKAQPDDLVIPVSTMANAA